MSAKPRAFTVPVTPKVTPTDTVNKLSADVKLGRPVEPGVVRLRPDDCLVLVLTSPLTKSARWHTEAALLEFLSSSNQAIVLDGTFAQLYVLRRE